MAIASCPECDGAVSSRAAACPHCGFPLRISDRNVPTLTEAVSIPKVSLEEEWLRRHQRPWPWIKIALVMIPVLLLAWCASQVGTAVLGSTSYHQACADTTAHCALTSSRARISALCERAVEEKIIYQFRWTSGWLKPAFDRSAWDDESAKVLIVAGDALEVQNQYGAFVNSEYYCTISLTDFSVLESHIAPGRFGVSPP